MFLLADAALLSAAYVVAHLVRFEGRIPPRDGAVLVRTLPLILATMAVIFESFGLYRRVWRYAGIADLSRVVGAITTGTLAAGMIIFLLGFREHSRFVLIAFYGLAVVAVTGFRVGVRNAARLPRRGGARGAASLIVGSGETGAMVLREIQTHPALLFRPVGIVSESTAHLGLRIHGVPVVGTIDDIAGLVSDLGVKAVIVADPGLGAAEYKRIVAACAPAGVAVRIFPSPGELLNGRFEVSRIRTVQVEDLLRRQPVPPAVALRRQYLGGKRVMVTGAGGSIGAELCRQTCGAGPSALIMVERVENALYEIDLELGERYPEVARTAELADIQDAARMREIFERERPHIVFHAAAFKHVPLMEAHPIEVVLNNIVGTQVLARSAAACGVGDFILISSDKAVNPVNVMGASKRATERYVQYLSDGGTARRTKFLAVRFGNVLGSAGSVIPRLRRQIEQGGPVTITHPQMTRYFMTIAEAVDLVIEAAAMGEGGEIFVLDMGDPVNVVDLAKDLIILSGLQPGRDIAIRFTGLRPGEKLDEELWSAQERPQPTKNPKIAAIRDGFGGGEIDLDAFIDELGVAAERRDVTGVLELLQSVVPEFAPRFTSGRTGASGPERRFCAVVADDDPEMRDVLSAALRREQVDVLTAADGVEALQLVRSRKPHVVVLDLRMPNLDGLSLFERLKHDPATRSIPVMLITGYAELGEGAKALEFEADDFISKPFRLSEFAIRVRAILNRRYSRLPGGRAKGDRVPIPVQASR